MKKREGGIKKCSCCGLEYWKDSNRGICDACQRARFQDSLFGKFSKPLTQEPLYSLDECRAGECIKDQSDKVALSMFRLITKSSCCGAIVLIPTCGCIYCYQDRIQKRKEKQDKCYQNAKFIKEFIKKHSNQPIYH